MTNKYRELLLEEFRNAVSDLVETKCDKTYWWLIDVDDENDWSLVLGWTPGFEPNGDKYTDEYGYHIEAKVGYQPYNSICQYDYDYDWSMPYNEDSGEVWDMSCSINDDLDGIVNWLLDEYDNYKNEMSDREEF